MEIKEKVRWHFIFFNIHLPSYEFHFHKPGCKNVIFCPIDGSI